VASRQRSRSARKWLKVGPIYRLQGLIDLQYSKWTEVNDWQHCNNATAKKIIFANEVKLFRYTEFSLNRSVSLQKMLQEQDANKLDWNVVSESDIECDLESLKVGKASGLDGLTKEHIIYSHPAIVMHLKKLFNIMYKQGFFPDEFRKGLSVPIIKDKIGDRSALDNYRAITLSPVISKTFEYCLLHKFISYLGSTGLQFGFKKGLGCSDAIFCVESDCRLFSVKIE